MHTKKALFSKIWALFLQNQGIFLLFSKKGKGDLPPPTPATCVPAILGPLLLLIDTNYVHLALEHAEMYHFADHKSIVWTKIIQKINKS